MLQFIFLSKKQLIGFAHCCFASLLLGCSGDVSRAFRIDQGIEPAFQDENVRFRTTYYFRTLTLCSDNNDARQSKYSPEAFNDYFVKKPGRMHVMSDSLYRFRMTGQASALFQEIHFESGVLRKEQIDPFGSSVRFNDSTKSFVVVPASEVREQIAVDANYQEIKRLLDLHDEIKQRTDLPVSPEMLDGIIAAHLASLNRSTTDYQEIERLLDLFDLLDEIKQRTDLPVSAKKIDGIIAAHLASVNLSNKDLTANAQQKPAAPPAEAKTPAASPAEAMTPAAPSAETAKSRACPNGSEPMQKFYLLGPEGVREFDQNERLLMTMASDSKPLISVLEQLSNRQLQSQQSSAAIPQALLAERVKLDDAQKALLDVQSGLSSSAEVPDNSSPHEVVKRLRSLLDPQGAATGLSSKVKDGG